MVLIISLVTNEMLRIILISTYLSCSHVGHHKCPGHYIFIGVSVICMYILVSIFIGVSVICVHIFYWSQVLSCKKLKMLTSKDWLKLKTQPWALIPWQNWEKVKTESGASPLWWPLYLWLMWLQLSKDYRRCIFPNSTRIPNPLKIISFPKLVGTIVMVPWYNFIRCVSIYQS